MRQCAVARDLAFHLAAERRAAKALVGKARNAKVVTVHAGHALMSEAPDEVLFALRDFLNA